MRYSSCKFHRYAREVCSSRKCFWEALCMQNSSTKFNHTAARHALSCSLPYLRQWRWQWGSTNLLARQGTIPQEPGLCLQYPGRLGVASVGFFWVVSCGSTTGVALKYILLSTAASVSVDLKVFEVGKADDTVRGTLLFYPFKHTFYDNAFESARTSCRKCALVFQEYLKFKLCGCSNHVDDEGRHHLRPKAWTAQTSITRPASESKDTLFFQKHRRAR